MLFWKTVEKMYRSRVYSRSDDKGIARYFSHKDFDGLSAEAFEFVSPLGHTLKGNFYSYENSDPQKLVIFDHGMGGGHRSYMKEIETLAKHGYKVFSYDHTGCMESGGKDTNGFAQSLNDLDTCIGAIKSKGFAEGRDLYLIGHSWGAYSCLNIAKYHPNIKKIVAISGFISVEQILKQNFKGILKLFYKQVYKLEKSKNPAYFYSNAADSLKSFDGDILVIHSEDDPVVSAELNFKVLEKALSGKRNAEFLLTKGKAHNPNYSGKAIAALAEYSKKLGDSVKKGKLSTEEQKKAFVDSFDWNVITEQDAEVWDKIFEHFKKA